MTFKERFQARECSFNMIEDWIELWHTWDIKMALPAFLGLSEEEYGVLLVEGYDALARRLNTDAETHYMAVTVVRRIYGSYETKRFLLLGYSPSQRR